MFLLRPLTFNDLQGLERLAVISGGSMTTLPNNRDHLSHLINSTRQSLRKAVTAPAQESYHFVLENSSTGEIIGVSGVEAAVGLETPFYSYRIDEVVHASGELQIHNRIPALHLCQDYTGASRLCTLFLDKAHRQESNLHLLSRARMLFMAAHPERFASRVMVELQGIADDNNQSPFWECLGRHFFNMDFNKANYLTGINSKGFIADLMPHYPVYVPLLSKEAQAALGKPREDMQAVSDLLEAEGFVYRKYVDIFDAGPSLEARVDNIRTVSQSQQVEVQIAALDTSTAPLALISNDGLENYRCLIAPLDASQPTLTPEQAQALQLDGRSMVRVVWL
ncbi:arginine N-succinyltransferase [Oceanospirillum multiglobuliferum]|uniref:Arginine N-succinyltransferase n=1 Tax=Oceanospirillum multiglobuliferum TaxID=64969 RepID=A0A1T4QTV2_9GAMM|nr:arginine N-succinyltransferase [Oceanospirillum multiglobuliferum]OPX57127.1 arginine N-succinyltransferase [Oceanospirillum multiglobuliferum]SKA07047.1 arginine N-succinyltransferase [Oceanospirillum multiglobuliferum]